MTLIKKALACLTLLSFAGLCFAVSLTSLYQANEPVADTSTGAWQAAVREGLAAVLVKVSGSADVLANRLIKDQLTAADKFVDRYQYQNESVDKQRFLQINYDVKAVNELLRNAGQRIWGRERPLLMVWVVEQTSPWLVDNTPERHLLYADQPVIQTVAQRLAARGLPVVFPVLGEQDKNAANLSAVWLMNVSMLQKISLGYGAEALLIGRLKQQPDGHWKEKWSLHWEGGVTRWKNKQKKAADVSTVLLGGLNHVINIIAERSAQLTSGVDTVSLILEIDNVSDLADYARLVRYLRSLSAVSQLESDEFDAQGQKVRLRVETAGGIATLRHALRAKHKLIPIDHRAQHKQVSDFTQSLLLRYRWQS